MRKFKVFLEQMPPETSLQSSVQGRVGGSPQVRGGGQGGGAEASGNILFSWFPSQGLLTGSKEASVLAHLL